MRAVTFQAHGGVDVLREETLPDPVAGPGEVVVRVRAVALNRLDLWVREGWRGLNLPMPHILGSDVAGQIESVGPGVDPARYPVGRAVVLGPGVGCGACVECLSGRDNRCARYHILGETTRGGYAERIVVPARNVFAKPERLSFAEAACLPLTFTTAWGMLVERVGLQPGQWILVHAAGSGVGAAAIQIARWIGATVIATAGSEAKLERARALGAHHAIPYADFDKAVFALTEKRGVDVVFEHTGGDTFARSLRALKLGGTVVTCGATSAPTAEIDLRRLFARQLAIVGHTMGSLAAMIPILDRAAAGDFVPVLDRVLPLAAAREAHVALAERAQFGKVVLEP
jgi:NADPH:quinone reductase-like Zn-dependent oxidoreductase